MTNTPSNCNFGHDDERVQGSGFPGFVRAHQGMIRAFLTRLTGNSALADDLAQEAFIKAHRAWGDIQSQQAAKAWMFQIAYNVYKDQIRKSARRRALQEGQGGAGADEDSETLSAPSGLKLDIEAAMNRLPPDMRAVIIMCLSYGMSHGEASLASGLPIGTVKSHIRRGRAQLTLYLSSYESV